MKNIDQKQTDRFIQIAAGGKKMNGEVKRMAEIPPLPIERKELAKTSLQEITMPAFNEQQAYADFLTKKKSLREYYEPYLQNYARKVKREEYPIVDFSFRKETQEDKADFSQVLQGAGEWEQVKIPHYVGPAGRWNAFYRTEIVLGKIGRASCRERVCREV